MKEIKKIFRSNEGIFVEVVLILIATGLSLIFKKFNFESWYMSILVSLCIVIFIAMIILYFIIKNPRKKERK